MIGDDKIFVFIDIDGVFNTISKIDWNPNSIELYDDLCQKYNLKPVITSTWRTKHTISELNRIFEYHGITTPIYDYTPIITSEGRGGEIELWLSENQYDDYLIIDDNVRDIESYGLKNIVKCRSWLGFTSDEYEICCEILNKQI
jgi:hypothetical protein